MAGACQRDGQVHRHRRLADTAFARRHADDPRRGIVGEKSRHRFGLCVLVAVAVGVSRLVVGRLVRPPAPSMPARRRWRSAALSCSFITTNSRSTSSTPSTARAARWISSASASAPGQAATGRATSRMHAAPAGRTVLSRPRSPSDTPSSGSRPRSPRLRAARGLLPWPSSSLARIRAGNPRAGGSVRVAPVRGADPR